MAGLLTDREKEKLELAFDKLAQTFERDIVVYKTPQRTVIVTDLNYTKDNADNQNDTNVQNTPNYETIKARVKYNSDMENRFVMIDKSSNKSIPIKSKMSEGMVRIIVNQTGYEVLKDTKKIELDGNMFDVDSLERPHGLFNATYYTFWLKRLQ